MKLYGVRTYQIVSVLFGESEASPHRGEMDRACRSGMDEPRPPPVEAVEPLVAAVLKYLEAAGGRVSRRVIPAVGT